MVELTNQAWASGVMRLDPYQLPHRVSFEREGHFSYAIDRNGAVLKRQLRCGLPVSMALPQRAFKGIAARVIEMDDGSNRFILELHHHDAQMCLPVLVADNMDDIAADWHSWSRLMKLPMLVIGEDNLAEPLQKKLGTILVESPIARRKRITSPKHRLFFARRRKMGDVGIVTKISAAEIIARN